MIDVKCPEQCGVPTETNPCWHRQVNEGINSRDGSLCRRTGDLGRENQMKLCTMTRLKTGKYIFFKGKAVFYSAM